LKSEVEPCIKELALIVNKKTGWSIKRSIRWCQRNWEEYISYIGREDFYRVPNETNMTYIYNEFIFQGFVPSNKFKRKKGFSYIISNRLILGKELIYPVHYSTIYKYLIKGYKNPYYMIGKIGVPGFTKVLERWK
jgi:hypothetical protein